MAAATSGAGGGGGGAAAAAAAAAGGRSFSFKVVLLGEGCVGKTSLVLRYCENKFNDKHITTLQVGPGGSRRPLAGFGRGEIRLPSYDGLVSPIALSPFEEGARLGPRAVFFFHLT